MPWEEVKQLDQRVRFIVAYQSETYSITELCERFGISRKTGYKWIQRFESEAWEGLKNRSRAARTCPHRTSEWMEAQLVAARKSHPTWGPKKLLFKVGESHPELKWPAASTVGDILKRHGLVKKRKRRPRCWHPGRPIVSMRKPNDVWTVDFKGEFRMGDRQYCYPLTVVDGSSRYLLACRGLPSTSEATARPQFERLFRKFGLPRQILSDNGQPFASHAIGGLSLLSIWWVRLGIQPLRIEPGHPEQNGRHERLHKTLKAETIRPPKANMARQQRAFNRFIREYNEERPHEALGQKPPGRSYSASPRPFPKRLPEPGYPSHFEIRRVGPSGAIHWRSTTPFVSKALRGQSVGLEEVDHEIWSVYLGPLLLGRFDERAGRTEQIK